jgi:hypothetical protein
MAEENLKGLVDGVKVPTQTLIQTLSLRFSHLCLSQSILWFLGYKLQFFCPIYLYST